MERAFATRLHDAGVDQSFQVVAQRRGRQIDVRLDFTGRRPLRAGLNDEAEDRESHGVAEGA